MNMKFFDYKYMPKHLHSITKPFHDIAHTLNEDLPDGVEKQEGLRRLMEARNCFVRAGIECGEFMFKSQEGKTIDPDDLDKMRN